MIKKCQIQEYQKLYIKYVYKETLIGGFDTDNNPIIVALDESLFGHNSQNEQQWIVGRLETKYRRMRLEIIKIRNATNLEIFVNNNFKEDTHFTHDGWAGYTFINDNMNYIHESYNHGGGDFGYGYGYNSTSHIENMWAF